MRKERLTAEERISLKDIIQDLDTILFKQVIFGILSILVFKRSVTDEQVKEIIEDAQKLQEVKNDNR